MQTILGANGQIGREVAVNLKRHFTSDIRLASRKPQKVNDTDTLVPTDLLDPKQTSEAVAGSDIVYFTAGLPMDTRLWIANWPTMMRNVIRACEAHGAKLVYFDNTYMYPQTAQAQTEEMSFSPHGDKGKVRAQITDMLLEAMRNQQVQAVICRAPEFYGPGITQSLTNTAVLQPLKAGKEARVLVRDDTLRTLIYTPDASRAMALLGNTEDAYGQTWHLPCDDQRLNYRQFVEQAAAAFGTEPRYRIVKGWQFKLAGLFNPQIRDAAELLPRYAVDNIFVSDKFQQRFPEFRITPISEGLRQISKESQPAAEAAPS